MFLCMKDSVCYAHSQPSPCVPLLNWYLLTDSNLAHCEPKPAYSDTEFHASKPVDPCTACGHSQMTITYCVQALAVSVCVPACTLKTDYATGPTRPSLLCVYIMALFMHHSLHSQRLLLLRPLFSDLHPEDCFAPQPVTSKTVTSVHPWGYYSTCSSSPDETG